MVIIILRKNKKFFRFFLDWLLNIDVSNESSSGDGINSFRLAVFIAFHFATRKKSDSEKMGVGP